MISIIISSADDILLEKVLVNIAHTIGVPYEVISTSNSNGKKGLAQVYNESASKAQYDVLCFMHEDIEFVTKDWGLKVLEILEDASIGLLGVAGANYKSLAPSGWGCPGLEDLSYKLNLIQQFKYSSKAPVHEFFNANNEKLSQVACIDGVWMCTRKSVFDQFEFDAQLLTSFHGYDMDLSLQIGSKYTVAVTFEILIEHFSEGNYSADWLASMLKVNRKHKRILPLNIGGFSKEISRKAELHAFRHLLMILSKEHYSTYSKLRVLWGQELYRSVGLKQFIKLSKRILFRKY